MIELHWAGESLTLLADRALWWPRRATLCIADLHLGKSAAFRAAGIPVPEDTTTSILFRISRLIATLSPARLIILGDLLHARTGRSDLTMSAIADWRAAHAALDILLIRGNHDLRAGDPPPSWNLRIEDEPHADHSDGQIVFGHDPDLPAAAPMLCGHIHPAAALDGITRAIKAPCFWFTPTRGILPAFGDFTGTRTVRPHPADRVFALGDNDIIEVSRAPITGGAGLRPAADAPYALPCPPKSST